jgi:phosphoglycolate phosphatase
MAEFRGYLFDLDGTLVDTAPDINAALNHALRAAGLEPVDETLTRHWVGHGAQVLIEQALRQHNGSRHGDPQALLEAFIDYYRAHIADHSRVYPAVLESLQTLRQRGANLAVVTNKRTALTEPLLDTLAMTHLFDSIVCGDTTAQPKPAADPALHACGELGLTPAEVLFVGDSETDVACARAAGCAIVCVRDGYNHGVPADALGADRVIDSFQELLGAPGLRS